MSSMLTNRKNSTHDIKKKTVRTTTGTPDREKQSDYNKKTPSQQQSVKLAISVGATTERQATNISLGSESEFCFGSEETFDNNNNKKSSLISNSERNVVDASVEEYESACYYLRIVPSKIVIKSLPLSSISLNNYGLNHVAVHALMFALKKNATVTRLDLSGNEIGVLGLKYLSNLFGENFTINDLNIARNYIGSGGIEHLSDIFRKNNMLRKLDISSNDFTDDDGVRLIEAIDDHGLHILNLSQNKLGERSGIAIGKWLVDNISLVDLNLSWNHLRKKGAIAISKGIWENNKLVRIDLSWNGFGNEGADIMGKALVHNMVLEELDLRSNRIGPSGFINICVGLKDNTTLKKLRIGDNNFNTEVVDGVLKLFQKINPLNLELFDISNVTLQRSIEEKIDTLKSIHPNLVCLHGFLNTDRPNKLELAITTTRSNKSVMARVREYLKANRSILIDAFPTSDENGQPPGISTERFKEIIQGTSLKITSTQLDALVAELDRTAEGKINLEEFIAIQRPNQEKPTTQIAP